MNATLPALDRFLTAQARDHAQALAEPRAGKKRSHWIWYVLSKLRELGRSAMARETGIADRLEAAAYIAHPVLSPRLIDCVHALLSHPDKTAVDAVGFLARITAALAARGIECNAVSAFHHDHLFVPRDKLNDALTAPDRLRQADRDV